MRCGLWAGLFSALVVGEGLSAYGKSRRGRAWDAVWTSCGVELGVICLGLGMDEGVDVGVCADVDVGGRREVGTVEIGVETGMGMGGSWKAGSDVGVVTGTVVVVLTGIEEGIEMGTEVGMIVVEVETRTGGEVGMAGRMERGRVVE